MDWAHAKPLKDENIFQKLEEKYDIIIPQDLKDLIKKNNGGRPPKQVIDFQGHKECVFERLISFNDDDAANITIFDELLERKYIPFASTPFGDLFCVNSENQKIEYYLHETDSFVVICDNVIDLLGKLYSID